MATSFRGRTKTGFGGSGLGVGEWPGSTAHCARFNPRAGVTLIELVVVVAIIGLIVGISFPTLSSGLDTIRLNSATDSVVALLNGALNRAERRQDAMDIAISPRENNIVLTTSDPNYEKRLSMPDGVRIEGIVPERPEEQQPYHYLVMPGSTPPRIGIQLANRRGQRRIVRVDPITGIPRIEAIAAQ